MKKRHLSSTKQEGEEPALAVENVDSADENAEDVSGNDGNEEDSENEDEIEEGEFGNDEVSGDDDDGDQNGDDQHSDDVGSGDDDEDDDDEQDSDEDDEDNDDDDNEEGNEGENGSDIDEGGSDESDDSDTGKHGENDLWGSETVGKKTTKSGSEVQVALKGGKAFAVKGVQKQKDDKQPLAPTAISAPIIPESDSEEDGPIMRNTVGNVPMEWY
jgi:hypothetical protein